MNILKAIRLVALTLLQGLIAAYHLFFIILVGLFSEHYTHLQTFSAICGLAIIFALPLIAGIILVNDAKWWLISLPVQFLFSVAVQYSTKAVPDALGGKVKDALFLLACQALGVGIKLLFMKLRAKKKAQFQH